MKPPAATASGNGNTRPIGAITNVCVEGRPPNNNGITVYGLLNSGLLNPTTEDPLFDFCMVPTSERALEKNQEQEPHQQSQTPQEIVQGLTSLIHHSLSSQQTFLSDGSSSGNERRQRLQQRNDNGPASVYLQHKSVGQ